MDQSGVGILVWLINVYTWILFARMFVTERERHDPVLSMVYKATDPVLMPLGTALRTSGVDLAPFVAILVLLSLKSLILRSVPWALMGFLDTIFQLYVLIIIIISGFREYYINPIANFAQRMVNPVRAVVANFSRHVGTVNFLTVLLLIVLHVLVTFLLNTPDPLKSAIIQSLYRILGLTVFFTYVIIFKAILSWVSPDPLNPVVQLITLISTPIIDPIRRRIPPLGGTFDISLIIAIIALQVVNGVGHNILSSF